MLGAVLGIVVGVLCFVLAVLVAGCAPTRGTFVRPAPIAAGCHPACYQPCIGEDGDTGIRWDGSPTDPAAFDRLTEEVLPALVEKLRTCEQRRKSCDVCLTRLDDAGVIQK
jgi:hypothetical protein